jgi:hypothetical protein
MVAKIALVIALVIFAVGAVRVSAGPGEGGQAASGYGGNMGSASGNLVPHW